MKITLIKPRIGYAGMERSVDAGRMEPLQMGVLKAMIPREWKVKFYDDRIDTIPFNESTDAVFLTVETFNAMRSYEIGMKYKKRGVKVIMGGMHPTLVPDEVAGYADTVFTGDAEYGLGELLDDLSAGRLKSRYNGKTGKPQPGLFPDRSIFADKGYLPVSLLQLGRGCINQCSFCATGSYFQGHNHMRDHDEVIEEIKRDCGKVLFFVDDNFIARKDEAMTFIEKLIPLKRLWVTQLTINAGDDPELLKLLKRSGCLGFVIGFESLNPDSLAVMNKTPNIINFDGYERQIKAIHRHHMNIWAAFTLGHEFETPATIRATYRFAVRHAFAFSAFNILTPYPSTPLYNTLAEQDRLLYNGKWWLHPDYCFNYAVFRPALMSPGRLTSLGWEARRRFNTIRQITIRGLRFRSRLKDLLMFAYYIYYCSIFHHEIYRKQGLRIHPEGAPG